MDTSVNIQADGTLIDDPMYQLGLAPRATSRAVLTSTSTVCSWDCLCQSKNQAGSWCHWVTTTIWTGAYFACPDCVAALIVVAKLPLMLAARIHVITPGPAVIKLAVGEACSDTNDCFDGKACLGGRCCEFTQSHVHR